MKPRKKLYSLDEIARAWNWGVMGYSGECGPHRVMALWSDSVPAQNMRTYFEKIDERKRKKKSK